MALRNKFDSLFDSPETASGISKKLERKQVLKVFSLKLCLSWPNPLMGVSSVGKICTRASAEPMHEFQKNPVISTDVLKIFG